MGWILLAGSVFLAVTRSPWWWILVLTLAVWRFVHWQAYSSRPWKRIHYPLMRMYAGAAGLESATAEREQREFDIRLALTTLVEQAEGCHRWDALARVITDWNGLSEEDEALIANRLSTAGGDPQPVQAGVTDLRGHFRTPDNALRVRLAIAGVIGRRLGSEHRAEYLIEAAKGNAP